MAAISSPGRNSVERGILQSTLSPKYLHTNSTSHTWPFSAIAELIDNAYDPDVKASQLWIDKLQLRGKTCLTFTDNGNGMTPDKLHKMLSFGFCEKVADAGHMPVGHYGNGFKSGSMRLGKDALVLTKQANSRSIGYLSQTYLEAVKAETVLVPIATWDTKPDPIIRPGNVKALQDIMKYSLVHSQDEIMKQFDKINGPHGTQIIISNIRKTAEKKSEFDFVSDEYDIRIPDDANTEGGKYRQTKRQNHIPECDYSLKAYCAILYLKPKMQIFLRGKKVKTLAVEKSLSQTEVDRYKPQILVEPVKVVFGFNSKNKNHYGIMMYHRNRLIKPYERVGYQLKANNLGVGVVGVVQCDFLQPTHNKQDFDYTKAYRACISSLGIKLNEYWNEKKGPARATNNNQPLPEPQELKALPDQNWVQCDEPSCLKWRKLPDDAGSETLPEKWYCRMNPDVNYKSCSIAEEKDEEPGSIQPYTKVQRKRLERELQEKNRREKEAQTASQMEQELKKRHLQEKEAVLQRKEEHLNKLAAGLQDSKTKIKVEGPAKLPTAQVLPRPTMVQLTKPRNTVLPTANQSPICLAQTRSTSNTYLSTSRGVPRASPRPPARSILQSTVKPGQSTPRTILSSQLTPLSIKPGTQIVKAKPVQSAPPSIRLITKAVPGSLDTSRLTFKVLKYPNGNAFLVQENGSPIGEKSQVLPSTPKNRPGVHTTIVTPKVAAIAMNQAGKSTTPKNPTIDVKPFNLSAVLPKPQASATNDRFYKIVSTTKQINSPAQSLATTVAKNTLTNVLTQVKPTSIPGASFPQLVNAISAAVTSRVEDKKILAPGVKREHSDNLLSPIPTKLPKKIDAVIVIDPLPSQNESQNNYNARIAQMEAEYKEKLSKLRLLFDEKNSLLRKTSDELDQKANELREKSSTVGEKTKQLKNLRENVCKLLQVLVPEIDVSCEGHGEGETIDELLKQVLEANQ